VAKATLPYYGLNAAGEPLTPEELFRDLSRAEAVCVGEEHPNPHHHFAQLEVLRELAARAAPHGRELGLGLEMFRFPDQPVLDSYAASELRESELLRQTRFEEEWGHDFALYRPLLRFSRRRGIALIALNAPPALTRSVAKRGLAGLAPESRELLPELDLDIPEHRELFERSMAGHPGAEGRLDRLYAAQVVWDETMADVAARWIEQRRPARQMIIVAGMAHCQRTAIPDRIERRTGGQALSVQPLLRSEGKESEPVKLEQGFDFGLVMETDQPSPHHHAASEGP
jgi:uncharacterized iron-regulated protein